MARNRAKQRIPEMRPQKKWLSKREAIAYMDIGINQFAALVSNGELSASYPTGGDKAYYSIDEINRLFERKIAYKAHN